MTKTVRLATRVRQIHRKINQKDFRVCLSQDVPKCDYYKTRVCRRSCNYYLLREARE